MMMFLLILFYFRMLNFILVCFFAILFLFYFLIILFLIIKLFLTILLFFDGFLFLHNHFLKVTIFFNKLFSLWSFILIQLFIFLLICFIHIYTLLLSVMTFNLYLCHYLCLSVILNELMFFFLCRYRFNLFCRVLIQNFEDTLFMIFAYLFSFEDGFDFFWIGLFSVLGIDLLFLFQTVDFF